ncbi:MAG: hypothetical protein ACRC6V_03225 [Bacteroidales bacterium]
MKYPERNKVYTLREIETELNLRDAAYLEFRPVKVGYADADELTWRQAIQTSHIDGLHKLEGWAETKWRYIMETSEWIPIFYAVDDEEIEELCCIEAATDAYFRRNGALHIYPKAAPVEQYTPMTPEIAALLITL